AKYRLTRMTNISPADVDTPTFDTFMQRAFCKDKELIEYTQLIIGASLVGKVYNENLIIANGSGANGKSTLLNALLYLIMR
ncbi:hypothetical protein, partial [Propionibacterium freudenreichii]|uniref:hypothetical protein n=1 Tax=Propionibacterium freudenreichii TaxID=1744 RepID=UPI003851F345